MNDNQDIQIVQDGGTLRAVHASKNPAAEASGGMPRAHASLRLDANGGIQSLGTVRYQVGSDDPVPTSIMATSRRTSQGLTVQTRPGDESSRTLVQVAMREGLVVETAPGHFVDRSALQAPGHGEPDTAPPPVTEKQDEPAPFAYVEPALMAEWNEMLEPLPQAAFDTTIAAAVSSIASGEADLGKAVARLSRESGMSPEEADEMVATGEAMYRHSLTQDLVRARLVTGADVGEFFDWCRGQRRLPEALSAMLNGGRTNVFHDLARDWRARKNAGQA